MTFTVGVSLHRVASVTRRRRAAASHAKRLETCVNRGSSSDNTGLTSYRVRGAWARTGPVGGVRALCVLTNQSGTAGGL